MSSQLLLFVVLLAILTLLLWQKKRKKRQAPAAPVPAPVLRNKLPISEHPGIDTVAVPIPIHSESAYQHWQARQWRWAIRLWQVRYSEVFALQTSQQFERALPADFNDQDRDRQVALRERISALQARIASYTTQLNEPAPDLTAYNNRGYNLLLLGQYEQAIADFDQAIKVDSVVAYAYNNRGLTYLRLGETRQALADITYSLQLDPGNSYAHRNLGFYYFEREQMAQALAAFERATELNPDTPGLKIFLFLAKGPPPEAGAPPFTSGENPPGTTDPEKTAEK
jgi:tetratricopeptide (TPR) repeat protein